MVFCTYHQNKWCYIFPTIAPDYFGLFANHKVNVIDNVIDTINPTDHYNLKYTNQNHRY